MTLRVRLRQSGPIALDVALECAPGEMLALVGPSGSGKTTVLRSIAGLYRPAEGRVTVGEAEWFDTAGGVDVAAHRRNAGFVFQSYALFPHMTALENVASALQAVPPPNRPARAAELLGTVRLAGLEDRYPGQLSGGQQQRVAVARAIARDPEVLLLDEPFSAVDRSTRRRLYVEIAELRESLGMPVILVTHDLEEAVMLADRICVIHRGETLQSGPPREVLTRPKSVEVARLVDLRNLFDGTVVARDPATGRGTLEWAGERLEVATLPPDAPPGTRAAWVIPEGFIVLHRRDRPSRGERENPVQGTVETALTVGDNTLVTMRTERVRHPLHFSVPAHVARRNGLARGVSASVSLLAEGIHVMPGQAQSAPPPA